jgi:hypothetical protein
MARWTKDAGGMIRLAGRLRLSGGALVGQERVIGTLPAGARPAGTVVTSAITNNLDGVAADSVSRIDIQPDGAIVHKRSIPASGALAQGGWISLAGIRFPAAGAGGWSAATLLNNWAHTGWGYQAPGVKVDATGMAHATGLVRPLNAGLIDGYQPFAQLPAAADADTIFRSIADHWTAGVYRDYRLDMGWDGAPYRTDAAFGARLNDIDHWLSLDGITYATPAADAQLAWASWTFRNGFAPHASASIFGGTRYARTSEGIVYLRGLATNPDGAPAGTTAFTLPAADAPPVRESFYAIGHLNELPAYLRFDVLPSGEVQIAGGGPTGFAGNRSIGFAAMNQLSWGTSALTPTPITPASGWTGG